MLLTTAILTASMTVAQPSAEDVKSVIEYYYSGTKPVIYDATLCKTIERKDKETKHDCKESYGASTKKGTLVNVYVKSMVPRGVEATIMIQASHNGVVRSTKDIKLNKKSWIRTRFWRGFSVSKVGQWEFKVLDEAGNTLKTLTIEATDGE